MTWAISCLLSMSIICFYSSLAYLPTRLSPRFYRHHKHQYTKKDDSTVESVTNSVRRDVVGGIGLISQLALLLTTSAASVSYATNTVGGNKPKIDETMPKDWNKRLRSGNAQMLPRGILQAPDVYYPSYMAGLWNTTSAGTGFTAPLGEKLFGGASAVRAAERDMNNTLIYPSLFSLLPDDDSGRVIADRLFNVKSIAVASMGEGAVFDESQPDSNPARRLHLGIAPSKNVGNKDVGNLFDIDLIAVSRQFRPSAGNTPSLNTSHSVSISH